MLITPEYVALNRELHASRSDYGASSYRWAQQVSALKDELGAKSVLDYGAGKGTLKESLGRPDWLREYDPAVPGKDERPAPADLVVCTDVLEHVERGSIDEVLNDLWHLTKRALFLCISTRPSSKKLDDGRNAHLIVEDGAWWKQKLSQFFHVSSWTSNGEEFVGVVHRVHTPGDIKAVSAVSETIRFEQVKLNIDKNKRRLGLPPVHGRTAVIACFGPSLRQSIPSIKQDQAAGFTIVTVSGAHDFLIDNGIVPDIHIDIDPRIHKGHFTRSPHPKVKYWMASCCHPSVIDNLLKYDLTLFHIANSTTDERIINELELDEDAFLVGGGGSVGCRAVNVMYTQGYRKFSIYGMDCSFSDDGEQHADFHSGKRQEEWKCRCGDRWFLTSGTLIFTAQAFIENMKALEHASREKGEAALDESGDRTITKIHGDGLLAAMVRENSPQLSFYRDAVTKPGEPDPYLKEDVEAA